MPTCAEQFPIEIWLMVFRYFEAHDLFQAFQNLNSSFDQILASSHLSFYVRLKETDNNHLAYPNNSYLSDSVLNRIVCLRSVIQSRSRYFLQFLHWHVNKLVRLQSLSITTYLRDSLFIPNICQALKELHRLEYLSLTCIPNEILFESVFSIPTLRICQLILRESTMTINHPLDVNSSIKQLFIVFLDNVNYSLINYLLVHTPKLKRFEISGSSFSFNPVSIFDEPLFILPELRILKLKLESGYFISDCFTCLHPTMPLLKHFYFHYDKHILTETFLDYFISHWWAIIETIPYIDISIKGHVFINSIDNNTQVNLQKNRQILLDRTNQSDQFYKIEWNEQDFARLKRIEITIISS